MHTNLKIFAVIIFLLITIPVATASQLTYNKDTIPMFGLNNSPIIETINGYYVDSNNSLKGGRIVDYDDANVIFDYRFFDRYGVPIDNKEVDILNFNINYKIKNNVETIIPFSFNLGEWPQLLSIIDASINVEITNIHQRFSIIDAGINVEIINITAGNSSLLIYGKNKSILISKLPPPFEYVLSKQNESTILSIIGRNVSKEGRLEIELRVSEWTAPQKVDR